MPLSHIFAPLMGANKDNRSMLQHANSICLKTQLDIQTTHSCRQLWGSGERAPHLTFNNLIFSSL